MLTNITIIFQSTYFIQKEKTPEYQIFSMMTQVFVCVTLT